jgi:hypothetical protein
MLGRIFVALTMVSITGCATTSRYAAHTPSTARVRIVTEAPGNTYFLVTREEECSTKFQNVVNDGDEILTVLNGSPISVLAVGSPKLLGIPGKEAHPEFTYFELAVDATAPVHIRTTNVYKRSLSPYDIGRYSVVGTLKLEAGGDYELIEDASAGCRLSLVRLTTDSSGKVARHPSQFLNGPRACPGSG